MELEKHVFYMIRASLSTSYEILLIRESQTSLIQILTLFSILFTSVCHVNFVMCQDFASFPVQISPHQVL